MIAVIKTGGKQYLVAPNATVQIEKLSGESGTSVTFDQVLLVAEADGSKLKTGTPLVAEAQVTGTIVRQVRLPKVRIVKFKPKVHYRRNRGHRQAVTVVKIREIK